MPGRERRTRRNGANGGGSMPPPWLSGWFDPELKDLFKDEPELYSTAHLLRSSRREAVPDDQYRRRLRAALMTEAEGAVGRSSPLRRWLLPGPRHLAWGGAAAGVALVAATALVVFSTHMQDHQTVVAVADVAAQQSVNPDQAVTVAFNQPMDQVAVVAGLHIQPATQVTTSWTGNSLVITPVHHFSGNTPYTVSIARTSLRTAIGTVAAAPVEITFGTASTPPPAGATVSPPALEPAQLGSAASGSELTFAPDGSVVATTGLANQQASAATPTAAGSAAPGTSPSAASAPASPSANGGAGPAPALVAYGPGGQLSVLGKAADAISFSPDGSRLAAAQPAGEGATEVITAGANGSNPKVVAVSGSPVVGIAWASSGRLIYATSGEIDAIDLPGATGQIALPSGTGPVARLSADGRFAYLAPSSGAGGTLLDIEHGTSRVLTGALSEVAFSGDGGTVVWVDQSSATPRLLASPVDRDAPAPVSTPDPGSRIKLAAVSRDGDEVAYTLTAAGGGARLVVAQLPSGSTLAVGPDTTSATFDPQGGALAYLVPQGGAASVELASVPGMAPSTSAVPARALGALNAFVEAQVSHDTDRLRGLVGSGVDPVALTPRGLTRAYTIDASAASPNTVVADVDLVVDPTARHLVPRIAVEKLTLTSAGPNGTYLVTAMTASALHDQSPGPHVVHVSSGPSRSHYVIQVTFDSDLAAATVAGAIAVFDQSGTALQGTTAYDANTRVATVTLDAAPPGPVTVAVDTSLMDVSGQHLAAAVRAVSGG